MNTETRNYLEQPDTVGGCRDLADTLWASLRALQALAEKIHEEEDTRRMQAKEKRPRTPWGSDTSALAGALDDAERRADVLTGALANLEFAADSALRARKERKAAGNGQPGPVTAA